MDHSVFWYSLPLIYSAPAADGLAIGAACLSGGRYERDTCAQVTTPYFIMGPPINCLTFPSSGSLALTASIGTAILIHKFPVAFGLSSYLRGSGWEGWRLQKGGGTPMIAWDQGTHTLALAP